MDIYEKLSPELRKAVLKMGFKQATQIQEMAFQPILDKKDLVIKARTGSGKTAAYAVPIIETLPVETKMVKALIIVPTRELAFQIAQECSKLGRHKKIRALAVFGKQPIQKQIDQLKQRVQVLVGTPGRVNDLIRRGALDIEDLAYYILDEADELLRRGFMSDLKALSQKLPSSTTTLLISATVEEEHMKMAALDMKDPLWIEVNEEEDKAHIEKYAILIDESAKFRLLLHTLNTYKPSSCLIFCNTREAVEHLYKQTKASGMSVLRLHGGMNQKDRLNTIGQFKMKKKICLISTDLAARGIDIDHLDLVINYELPLIIENFVHRIGRTGRQCVEGKAISLIAEKEMSTWESILAMGIDDIKMLAPENILKDKSLKEYVEPNDSLKEKHQNKINALTRRQTDNNRGTDQESELTQVYINIGKNKKIRPLDIVGAISNIEGIEASDIGIIEVRDHYSYVDIMNNKVKVVLKNLEKVKGKKVKVRIREVHDE